MITFIAFKSGLDCRQFRGICRVCQHTCSRNSTRTFTDCFQAWLLSVLSTFSLSPACLRLLPAGPFLCACPQSQAVEDTLLVTNCSSEVVFLYPFVYWQENEEGDQWPNTFIGHLAFFLFENKITADYNWHTQDKWQLFTRVNALTFYHYCYFLKLPQWYFNKSKVLGARLKSHVIALICHSLENSGLPQSKGRKLYDQHAKGRCCYSKLAKTLFFLFKSWQHYLC